MNRLSLIVALAALILPAHASVAQTVQEFDPPRPPPPTDLSIPVPDAPKAAKPAQHKSSPKRILPPPKQPMVGVDRPPIPLLEMMVRTVLVAVNQANFTENYAVLHALGTREMQTKTTPEELGKSFAILRKQAVDLTTVLSYPVVFSRPPAIGKDGEMELVGTIPSEPHRVAFTILYFPVAGYWRIDSLTIAVSKHDKAAEQSPAIEGSPFAAPGLAP